jgi:hypothetical protein
MHHLFRIAEQMMQNLLDTCDRLFEEYVADTQGVHSENSKQASD